MKKRLHMKKRLVALGMSLMMICGFTNFVYAAEEQKNLNIPIDALAFKSIDDETGTYTAGLPIQTRQKSGLITSYFESTSNTNLSGYKYDIYASGDSTTRKEFVRYLTGSWAKADGYTWSKSQSASWTVSGGVTFGEKIRVALGLSKSRTTTYSVAVHIPANANRESKLAFGSDFFTQDYYVNKKTINSVGTVTATVTNYDSGYVKTPTKDSYLYVIYK